MLGAFCSWLGDSDENGAFSERFNVVRHFPFESQQFPFRKIENPACGSDHYMAYERLNGNRSCRTVLGEVCAGTETNE